MSKQKLFAEGNIVTWDDFKEKENTRYLQMILKKDHGQGPFVVLHTQELPSAPHQKLHIGKKTENGHTVAIDSILSAYWFKKFEE
ncbi:MAG: hypothetical protein NT098_05650 [Candidatus Parcubacteria bacterium]|nr:hypothetical protein [Candidatus Parcubacteria bacterium]